MVPVSQIIHSWLPIRFSWRLLWYFDMHLPIQLICMLGSCIWWGAILRDLVGKWRVPGRWVSLCTVVGSTYKSDLHRLSEIMLTVTWNMHRYTHFSLTITQSSWCVSVWMHLHSLKENVCETVIQCRCLVCMTCF
jgi:hypothetical protein